MLKRLAISRDPVHANPATKQTLIDLYLGDTDDSTAWIWAMGECDDTPDPEVDPDVYWSHLCCAAVTEEDLKQLLRHEQHVEDRPPSAVLDAARRALAGDSEAWHTAMMFIADHRGSL